MSYISLRISWFFRVFFVSLPQAALAAYMHPPLHLAETLYMIVRQIWQLLATPYLKDFWRIGIHVSHANGYTLQPRHVFHANLQAHIQMIFSKAFQDGADKLT